MREIRPNFKPNLVRHIGNNDMARGKWTLMKSSWPRAMIGVKIYLDECTSITLHACFMGWAIIIPHSLPNHILELFTHKLMLQSRENFLVSKCMPDVNRKRCPKAALFGQHPGKFLTAPNLSILTWLPCQR
ncbi:hypothetical protein VNO77_07603 [Canavalia gladiata]|uniref:Uncharacterized protein n=1 Tax=Canavalia gladiata TaxID=3824 RepID=A0AAN9M8J3_CANGL